MDAFRSFFNRLKKNETSSIQLDTGKRVIEASPDEIRQAILNARESYGKKASFNALLKKIVSIRNNRWKSEDIYWSSFTEQRIEEFKMNSQMEIWEIEPDIHAKLDSAGFQLAEFYSELMKGRR